MKKHCMNCGAKIDENYEICPFCFVFLLPGFMELDKKQKKIIKSEKLRKLSIIIAYLLFFSFTISWIIVSGKCFIGFNRKCLDLTIVLMILSWISCCIAPVLYGKELPKQ